MRKAIALLSIAAMLVFASVAFAADVVTSDDAQYAGHIWIDAQTGNVVHAEGPNGSAAVLGVNIYSNVTSAANGAISSTSLASQWGDHVVMTGLGILAEQDLTIYNGSSTGALLTCSVAMNFYNFNTSALIGGYTGNINFGAGLNPGFYSIVTFTNLDLLAIPVNFTTNDIVVVQNLTAKTGAATRFGVVSFSPVTIGTSPVTMYINSSTIGAAGYYQLSVSGTPIDTNPGYRINAIAPVPTQPTTWGKVKNLYR